MKKLKKLLILIFSYSLFFSIPLLPSEPEFVIINTALSPQTSYLFSDLDILAKTAKSSKAMGIAKLNLDTQNILFNSKGHQYLYQEIKAGKIGDSLFNASLVSLIGLNIADYFSTREALKHDHLQEANPIMKPFVKDPYVFAAVKIGLTAFSFVNLKNLYKKNKPLAWILSMASNLAMSYIVSNNFRLIQQAREK